MQRHTHQRSAIRRVMASARRPLSTGEILAKAATRVPGLGIATVYRALRALVEAGEIVPVEMAGQPPRYERAGLAHHHHFHCDSCGKVFELAGCALSPRTRIPRGFRVKRHELTFHGTCASCLKSA